MSDDKYVVFKRDEFQEWVDKWAHRMDAGDYIPKEIEDAVVLRLQDRFTVGALESYACSVLAAIEVIEDLGFPSSLEVKKLKHIAEYFMDKATEAMNTQRKTPD